MDLVANGLEQAQLEAIPALDADAKIREDKEALMTAINVFEVVETRDAAASSVPCFAIRQQVQLLVPFSIG